MKTPSGQNYDNKMALQVNVNPTAANIMDLLQICVINKQYLFQRVIFSNMTYFCINYTNTFFIHTMNYFSVVLWIIFLMCMENYFFIGPRIIFRSIANLFWAYNVLWALQLKWTGSSLWLPLGDNFENFEVEECFQRECHGETLSGKETKEVFIFCTKYVSGQ